MFKSLFGPEKDKDLLGVNLTAENRVAAVELKNIAEKYKKRHEQIDSHIKKASKDRELANKLANSFIHNYTVMVDISVLLNQYAEFFQSIKELLSKSDMQLEQLNAQNFQNLERLTRQEMDKFTSKFNDQAEKVKRLFQMYNMNEQAAKLSAVPSLTSQVSTAAEDSLRADPRQFGAFTGGKKYLRKRADKFNNGGGQKKKGT